ncbi:angiopoietin-related protein 7 [Drosophila grimshawi]|uniref:angiopoietin-related protein 7 n=1 Tax=Drosophila grimshawi TaxID=7222 RepID=UPI001C93652A|nr:angiopoietin-related protein 7 [Drosophila grimshawi]
MLLSMSFVLALSVALYSDAQTYAGAEKSKSLMSTWEQQQNQQKQQQKLTLISRAQDEQKRKLLSMDFKLNQVLSKLITLTHAKQAPFAGRHSMTQFAASWNMAMDRFERNSNRLLNRMQQNVKKWQREHERHEHINRLEEVHAMLALLVKSSQSSTRHNEDAIKLDPTNDSNLTKPLEMAAYLQPALADCSELDEQQRVDGVYKLLEPEWNEVHRDFHERSCAFATAGPAWTIIQRRSSVGNFQLDNFNRSWNEYRTGFGDFTKDFWFGNEFIHRIVDRDDYVLRIELQFQNGTQLWTEYELFRLDSESYNYQLVIGQLNGNSSMSDALINHNRMDFRAYDRNGNDECYGGWWFDRCQDAQSNLNAHSIIWGNNGHNEYLVKASRMLIRPRHSDPLDGDDIYAEDSIY